jgi:hypothetical protein
MDLTFLVDKEKEESFSIEVSFFDSFLEVKEKIYNYQNLPISNQELYFNGKLLKDEDIIMKANSFKTHAFSLKRSFDFKFNSQVMEDMAHLNTFHKYTLMKLLCS